jgi:hypothetical protein
MASEIASFAAGLRAALREERSDRLVGLPDQALAWLALSPGWPASLAREGFPGMEGIVKGPAAEEVLRSVVKAGMAEVRSGAPPWAENWYLQNRLQRTTVFSELSAKHAKNHSYFARAMNEAATAMARALGVHPPPQLARWVTLGTAGGTDAVADTLDNRVQWAIAQARKSKQLACPEALRWIETAEPLAQILAANLEVSLARSLRRLELFHRQSRDERLLENYQTRKLQEQAFLDLLNDDEPNAPWALHLIGYGGAGKTMLMRRIKTTLAHERGLVTARIDFDNLNPFYPSRAPGLLLMGFAEELRLSDDTAAANLFVSFDRAMRGVHERLESAFRTGSAAAAGGVERLGVSYETAEHAFIDALARIAARARPVLILDTCEELAKVRSGVAGSEALRATFEILERLHEKVDTLRVVFSGRRMLSSAGAGWELPGSQLPPRSYLKLVELHSFDEAEARELLQNYRRDGRRVPASLTEPLLIHSATNERHVGAAVIWGEARGPEATKLRYNPYDLDLLASMACSDRPPAPEDLAQGLESFVLERIDQRLSDDLRHILVDISILGRFDRDLLELLTGREGEAMDAAWDELRNQEWSEIDRSAVANAEVLTMEAHLQQRVRAYFEKPEQGAAWRAARQRLRQVLSSVIAARDWKDLQASYFVVALDVLSDDPATAARWWGEVEARIATSDAWEWAREITNLLTDDEDPAGIGESGLRAAVSATRASAMLRLGHEELGRCWRAVEANASRHPVQEDRKLLSYRARAGLITYLRLQPDAVTEATVSDLQSAIEAVPDRDSFPAGRSGEWEVFGTEIGMLESAAEALERIDWRAPPPFTLLNCLRTRAQYLAETARDEHVVAVARVLRARFTVLSGDGGDLDIDWWPHSKETRNLRFLDWLTPDDLGARMTLEVARLNRPDLPSELHIISRLRSLDWDRYWALRLMAASNHQLVELDLRPAIEDSLRLARHKIVCVAHHAVPPFFVVALELRAQAGEFLSAAQELQRVAADPMVPLETCLAAQRAAVRIATRFRLFSGAATGYNLLELSSRLGDAILISERAAFAAQHSAEPFRGRWREGVDLLMQNGQDPRLEPLIGGDASFAAFSLALDESEGKGALADRDALTEWERRHPRAWLELAILRVRLGLAPSVGSRLAAELMFEEGALLALREPGKGAIMLDGAARLYASVRDTIGERLSLIAAALAYARANDSHGLARAIANPTLALEAEEGKLGSGWELRLKFARCRAAEFESPGPATVSLLRETASNQDVGALDIQNVLGPRHSPPRTKMTAARRSTVLGLIAAIVGVPIFGLLLSADPLTFGLFGLGYVGEILLFVLLLRFLVRLTYRFWVRELALEPSDPVHDPNRPLRATRIRLSRAATWPFEQYGRGEVLPTSGADNYAALSVDLLGGGSRRILWPPFLLWPPLSRRILTRAVPLKLRVDLKCASVCWEGVLGLDGRTIRQARSLPFNFYRTNLAAPRSGARDMPAPVTIQFLSVGHRAGLRSTWAKLADRDTYRLQLASPLATHLSFSAHVIHIVCEVAEGPSGLELHFTTDAPTALDAEPSEFDNASSRISPRLLASGLEGPPRLCILQGFSLIERTRTQADRYAAGLMRRAAAELFDAGTLAVLIIPPVPEVLSAEVILPVVNAVGTGTRLGRVALLRALQEIRRTIAPGKDDPDALERALDVCLYCVPDLRLSTF